MSREYQIKVITYEREAMARIYLAHIKLPLPHGRDPLDDVEQEPGAPAGREHQDDDQQHLDDLLPALVDLVGLVDCAGALLHHEDSLASRPSLGVLLIQSLCERRRWGVIV